MSAPHNTEQAVVPAVTVSRLRERLAGSGELGAADTLHPEAQG